MWWHWLQRLLDAHAPIEESTAQAQPAERYTSADLEAARRDGMRRGIEQERKKYEACEVFEYCACGAPLILHKSADGRHRWASCAFDVGMTTDPLPRVHPFPAMRYLLQQSYQRGQTAQRETQQLPKIEKPTGVLPRGAHQGRT